MPPKRKRSQYVRLGAVGDIIYSLIESSGNVTVGLPVIDQLVGAGVASGFAVAEYLAGIISRPYVVSPVRLGQGGCRRRQVAEERSPVVGSARRCVIQERVCRVDYEANGNVPEFAAVVIVKHRGAACIGQVELGVGSIDKRAVSVVSVRRPGRIGALEEQGWRKCDLPVIVYCRTCRIDAHRAEVAAEGRHGVAESNGTGRAVIVVTAEHLRVVGVICILSPRAQREARNSESQKYPFHIAEVLRLILNYLRPPLPP